MGAYSTRELLPKAEKKKKHISPVLLNETKEERNSLRSQPTVRAEDFYWNTMEESRFIF